jgi:RimJ/RimL family protein N-acetyltransferase
MQQDLTALTALNADPQVNSWLGGEALALHSAEALQTMRARLDANGWGVLAACDLQGELLGLAGLQPVRSTLPAAPAVEAVWRLRPAAWGRGYVVEAMQAMLGALPADAGLDQVVALVAKPNLRSASTALALGFRHDPAADFLHPALDPDHPLRPHRVYRRTIRPLA